MTAWYVGCKQFLVGGSLWAQTDAVSDLGRQFRGTEANMNLADGLRIVMLVCSALCLVWLIGRLVAAHRRRALQCPRRLFQELCHAHQLDRRSRQLLAQLAAAQHLSHAAQLFLQPESFDPAALNQQLQPHAAELQAIRDQIFGRRIG